MLEERMTTDDWKLLGEIIGTPGHWQQFTQHDHNKKAATLQKQALARLKALVRPAKREVLGLQDVVTASGKDLARTGSSGGSDKPR